MKTLFITGGAGFIGSALIRNILRDGIYNVVNIDKLTYAGSTKTIDSLLPNNNYSFEHVDICNREAMSSLYSKYQPDGIIHLAAESHVDRSIHSPDTFIQTNVIGTYVLLEESRIYWEQLDVTKKREFRFHHVSTDEVFGDLTVDAPPFNERTPYAPSSPYSASKASSDHLVRAWHRTYGLPVVLSNCSNNYGPYQFPEKLIPVVINNALQNKPLPIYGQGKNIRDWLYVDDHVDALLKIFAEGVNGESYAVGGNNEVSNLELVKYICGFLDTLAPRNIHYDSLIEFVNDRPGHDLRYAIDSRKIQSKLGWKPANSLEAGLRKTVEWYMENPAWLTK